MSDLCKIISVSCGSEGDINGIKAKGISAIMSHVEIKNGIYDSADQIIKSGKDVQGAGLKWSIGLNLLPLYEEVKTETGADNRMFVRKAERGGFENIHKLFTRLSENGALPSFAQINSGIFDELQGINLSFEEQTRMVNAVINAVKAVAPECKVIISTKNSTDNEAAKKWFNRFQVSGGKKFDIISLEYELSSETFYDLSLNMSDLSRRFEAEIIVDISGQADVASADIGLEDLDSAVSIVPLDRGFGTVYSLNAIA
ncbi:Glycosyl hydrolase family 53 [Lachnospiraceae bacterium]|nr:Glycosyl hydrolase family 53 [Lachnospiraceae bacterium]